jgi:hypothetical protein
MTAFKQVLTNLQQGQREEAMIGLEFVLRLDPGFAPATNLKRQLSSSTDEIDLGDIIAQLQAPTTDAIDTLLIEAVDDFNARDFLAAKHKVEQVLIDLPGHQEARELRDQVDKALKIENQVGQFLVQAREALGKGDPQEAANFVMMAQALDPHHTGIATTLKEIDQTGGLAFAQNIPGAPVQPQPFDGAQTVPPQRAAAPGESMATEPLAPEQPGASSPVFEPTSDDGAPADDAFAFEFDSADPFADVIEQQPDPGFGPSAGGDAEPGMAPTTDAGSAFPNIDDTADLFTAPTQMPGPEAETSFSPDGVFPADGRAAEDPGFVSRDEVGDETSGGLVQDLITRGDAASEGGDPARAISIWSRVFLTRPTHPEVAHRIEQAKKRLAAAETEVTGLIEQAREAMGSEDLERASLLIDQAQALRPGHLGAALIREELDQLGAAPPMAGSVAERPGHVPGSATPELPDLDDELFADLPDLAADPGSGAGALDDDLFRDDKAFDDFEPETLVERITAKLSLRTALVVAVALVVVLAGGWMGSRFLSSEPEGDEATKVNEVLIEADRLFKEHKVEEAIHLLREFPASGLFKQRIDMRIAKYEESTAAPTPTPMPEHASRAEDLLTQGLWWAAFTAAAEGLREHPDDQRLQDIRRQIVDLEPDAEALERAIQTGDFRTAVSIAEELLQHFVGQSDLTSALERCLFNAALAESRAYNLTGAENHLLRLLELQPGDDEAVRFLEFVQKYKVRAADMRLEIFIRSMAER